MSMMSDFSTASAIEFRMSSPTKHKNNIGGIWVKIPIPNLLTNYPFVYFIRRMTITSHKKFNNYNNGGDSSKNANGKINESDTNT